MRRELRFGANRLDRRVLRGLAGWSLPELLPAAVSGTAVARALDDGFLAGRPGVGVAWLAAIVAAAAVGALGSRQVYRRLGELVEPFRDDLVSYVVHGALARGINGRRDDGAVARLTHQVEIARDTYGGLIMVVRGFAVSVLGAVAGLLALSPAIAALVLPPFLIGLGLFVATLGLAAARHRAYVATDEQLAARATGVLRGVRDVTATGSAGFATALVDEPVAAQAAAERALANVALLRVLCQAVGGWGPLVVLLAASPRLAAGGLSAGALLGGLTYVASALQPALNQLISGLGSAGLRFVVTVGRLLEASVAEDARGVSPAAGRPVRGRVPVADALRLPAPADPGHLTAAGLTFAYGPGAAPVLRNLHLTVARGDHLAVVGPSGIGKSTLAGLLCGMLTPDAGTVRIGGVPIGHLAPSDLATRRVLIPQEAYVFAGSVWANLTYLRPHAEKSEVVAAAEAVGSRGLVERLGGWRAPLDPGPLSAGERQLIALTRAYLSPAGLAVLDEATCYLDPAAERRAEEAFAARPGAVVIVAHRVSSALRAKRVLVLDGVSAVAGDHDTVVARSPLYRELLGYWSAEPHAAGAPPAAGVARGGGGAMVGVAAVRARGDAAITMRLPPVAPVGVASAAGGVAPGGAPAGGAVAGGAGSDGGGTTVLARDG
ncbi:ABC transporter ATP-binding protein [Pilimelia anulata]|uniref:ABC transporter ATP-binding protein n=1 Tax=Pilimelia anulata TaxID=53371 RepID=A0A8J3B9Z0_9ACTN|nr:ABC transporter ATP-binding protein [Pilimelia anulata]GGK06246.1 ABC transporter ATP-binding protein [Pilimelia anulata]